MITQQDVDRISESLPKELIKSDAYTAIHPSASIIEVIEMWRESGLDIKEELISWLGMSYEEFQLLLAEKRDITIEMANRLESFPYVKLFSARMWIKLQLMYDHLKQKGVK